MGSLSKMVRKKKIFFFFPLVQLFKIKNEKEKNKTVFLQFSFFIAQLFLMRVDFSAYKLFSFLEVTWHHISELGDGKKKMSSKASFKKMSCNQESSSASPFPKVWPAK